VGVSVDRLHAIITGQVQGVGFRYFVKRNAEALSLTGYVRNLPEGQVEVLAEGSPSDLQQMQKLLELGPSGAVVIDVCLEYGPATGKFNDFRIASNVID